VNGSVQVNPDPLPKAPAWFFHRVAGERRLGVVIPEEGYFDVGRDDEAELLAEGSLTTAHLRSLAAEAEPITTQIAFDVPVRHPSKILCFGKNYAAHAAELGSAVPEEPFVFAKFADTLVPHEGTVVIPHWLDTRVDHEIELLVVLGFRDPQRAGRRYVPADRAHELIAGYTVFNDVTARKLQAQDRDLKQPWLRAKSLDTFGPVGPWVVARDGLDPSDLRIQIAVNGETRQDARTSQMVVAIGPALEFLSRHYTLRPGDLVAMGTPAGIGPIKDGDELRGEIEGIGVLRSRVHKAAAPPV
jgi:2-keto-4-pentenoate hydratase/2-oxohepta-3-ene-1,7-dioic acid hydratase in catechol pathway